MLGDTFNVRNIRADIQRTEQTMTIKIDIPKDQNALANFMLY